MSPIVPGAPRTAFQARFPDGRIFEAPPGTPIQDVIDAALGAVDPPVVGAIVNGRLRELVYPLTEDASITPLDTSTSDGVRIYRRSLAFLLLVAVDETFPGTEVYIEHSATTAAGYFCEVRGRGSLSAADLDRIDRRMREIVAADEPIIRRTVPVPEAISLFRDRGETDTARLLAHRAKGVLVLYEMLGRRDYFQGYMVPSAGCLRHFALRPLHPGFVLLFPHQQQPTVLVPPTPYPKLFRVFEEAGNWLDRLGIRDAGALNDAIVAGRLREVSLVAEALHESGIARIAADLASSSGRVRVVLVAGPSASGKTTFAKRLAVQLLVHGLRPMPIGLDDYFVDRDRTPKDDRGEYNYETIRALDLDLFNRDLQSLVAGHPPRCRDTLLSGQRESEPTGSLSAQHVISVEGIQGLNPALVPGSPAERVYRVYVSALTHLNLDRHNRVSTTDCRLIRRVVRDAATRGYTAADTLRRWDSVVRGEKQHIFCFQENADAIFNSALVYELAVLRPYAEPLLLQVRPDTPEYPEANRLLSFLQWFRPAPPDLVADNSILREFVGGSILEQFSLWPTTPDKGGSPRGTTRRWPRRRS